MTETDTASKSVTRVREMTETDMASSHKCDKSVTNMMICLAAETVVHGQ